MRYFFVVLVSMVAACDGGPSGQELTAVGSTGGFCPQEQPWCGFDATYTSGGSIQMTSRSAPATALGVLTDAGRDELADLLADLHPDTRDDELNCQDAPEVTLSVRFSDGSARDLVYECPEDELEPIAQFLGDVHGAVISGCQEENERVICAIE